MLQNRFFRAADGAHLTFGLSAAPSVQGGCHLFIKSTQVSALLDQAVAVAPGFGGGEHGGSAAAAVSHQVSKLPDAHGVEIFPDQQGVALSGAALGNSAEEDRLQLRDAPLLGFQLDRKSVV